MAELEKAIREADERIVSVLLVDSYTKPEWQFKKSLTFRFTAYDPEGTLTKEMIDSYLATCRADAVTAIGS